MFRLHVPGTIYERSLDSNLILEGHIRQVNLQGLIDLIGPRVRLPSLKSQVSNCHRPHQPSAYIRSQSPCTQFQSLTTHAPSAAAQLRCGVVAAKVPGIVHQTTSSR
jgi:hypothetical protein